MAENNPHVEDLKAFRAIYVDERRREVRTALELRQAIGDGGLLGEKVKAIQEIIDAIDDAIKDEVNLAPRDYTLRHVGD